MRSIVRVTVAAVATLLVAAGCSNPPSAVQDPLRPSPNAIRLYGTDGNMANSVAALVKEFPTGLDGMKGTAPLTPLPPSFRERLLGIDPKLTGYLYAGEAYDAVVISSLAAILAQSTGSKAIAAQIPGVTTRGTPCDTPKQCINLIEDGKDIAYRGISLHLGGLTEAGEPSASTYGILRFGGANQIDSAQTEYVQAGDPGASFDKKPPAPQPYGNDAPLKIGALLPHTGQLASAGPPMFAGVRLAIDDVNAAGGVLGRPVTYVDGDDGTSVDKATQTAQRFINDGVQVIVGAGASGITKAVLPTIVEAGVVLFSPCNTAAELSAVDDQGLYFRTAPADGLQAAALTNIIMRDGVRKLVILARDDAYGKGLMDAVKLDLLESGLSESDISTVAYNTDKPDFSGLGQTVREFEPDAVLVIGYDESAEAFTSLLRAGFTSRIT